MSIALTLLKLTPCLAQNGPYTKFESDEAELIFLRPEELKVDQNQIDVLADFTVILKKTGPPDSVRMSFTISAPKPVLQWNYVELKMKDTSYKDMSPSKIYQEKKNNHWDNRFQIMIPLEMFQKFIAEESVSQFLFSFDDKNVSATFGKKQSKALGDFALQIQLDLKK